MGFFSKNWAKELDRAEDLLGRNLPVPALEIAEKAERKAEPDVRSRAAGMVLRARQGLLASVLAKADAAEAAGDLEDAADWLTSAVEQEPSSVRRDDLEARRQALLDRVHDLGSPLAAAEHTITVVAHGVDEEVDASFQYEILTTMMADEIRELYEGRPVDFQQALVDLNEGRTPAALSALEALVEAAPDDAVLRLERGRARLISGESAAARDDFAAAWKSFGEQPLDANASHSVPTLWAEASLATGDAAEVAERLEPLASPESGHPELCRLYATALIATERIDDAVGYLEAVTSSISGDPELNLVMAQALAAAGDPQRAIAGLELGIAPSCASGGCAKPPPHVPSFRLLARLYLVHGEDPERACELIALIANARQGYLEAEDHAILAEYYKATGNTAAEQAATTEADRLAQNGQGAVGPVQADLGPQHRRVL
jgi:tetratricopeptide (TPR) repeat protein